MIYTIENSQKFIFFCKQLLAYYNYNLTTNPEENQEITQAIDQFNFGLEMGVVYGIDQLLGISPHTIQLNGFASLLSQESYFEIYYELRELFDNWNAIISAMSDINTNQYYFTILTSKLRYDTKIMNEMAALVGLNNKILFENNKDIVTGLPNFDFAILCDPSLKNSEINLQLLISRVKQVLHNKISNIYKSDAIMELDRIAQKISNAVEKYLIRSRNRNIENKHAKINLLQTLQEESNKILKATTY